LAHFVATEEDQKSFQTNVSVPSETLSKYAGIYESVAPGGKLTYEVSIADGRLLVRPPMGGGRIYFAAASQTTFVRAIAGDSVEFVTDAEGRVTHFVYRSLEEGERRAVRKSTP
jgi:hypothetical protein